MSIQFECECGETLEVGEEFAGKRGRCPSCKAIVRVPEMAPEPLELRESLAEDLEESQGGQKGEAGQSPGDDQGPGQQGAAPDRGPSQSLPWASWVGWRRAFLFAVPFVAVVGVLLYLLLGAGSKGSGQRAAEQQGAAPASKEARPQVTVVVESTSASAPQASAVSPATGTPEERRGGDPEDVSRGLPGAQAPLKEGAKEVVSGASERKSSAPAAKSPGKAVDASGRYTVRVGSFREQGRAERLAADLKKRGLEAFVWTSEVPQKGRWHRVGVGRFENRQQAQLFARGLKEKTRLETVVTSLPSGGR